MRLRELLPRFRRVDRRSARRRLRPCGRSTRAGSPDHGWIAPSDTDEVGVGNDELRIDLELRARPAQCEHAPYGVLNENCRGASSSKLMPQFRQAKFCEKECRSGSAASPLTISTSTTPCVRPIAVSSESASRDRMSVTQDDAVDDHLDRVLLVPREPDLLGQVLHLTVDASPREPLTREVAEHRLVLALAALHDGGEDHQLRSFVPAEDRVGDLLDGLPLDRTPALVAVRLADARVEQPEVVVDLGDGSDRRSRVARGRLLVDRDRRRQALDDVDVRLLHLPEELAGVGGQRLDVPPLPFGVDRVEGERGLARSRDPGEDDQRVAGQVERDVAQVVLPRAPDVDGLRHVLPSASEHPFGPSIVPTAPTARGASVPPVFVDLVGGYRR